MRFLAVVFLGLALAAGPVAAAEQLYLCAVNNGEEDGSWISADYVFIVDPETKVVVVSDPVILHFNKNKPIDATLVAATPAKTVFTWAVFASNSAGQRTRMVYRAVLFTAGAEFSVLAKPIGFDNSFSARGNCQPG